MMIPDRKRAVGVILSKFGKNGSVDQHKLSDGGEVPGMEVEPDMSEAKHAHASAMIDAMHNKDPKAMVHAMNSFLEEHELHTEKDQEEKSDYSPKE